MSAFATALVAGSMIVGGAMIVWSDTRQHVAYRASGVYQRDWMSTFVLWLMLSWRLTLLIVGLLTLYYKVLPHLLIGAKP